MPKTLLDLDENTAKIKGGLRVHLLSVKCNTSSNKYRTKFFFYAETASHDVWEMSR